MTDIIFDSLVVAEGNDVHKLEYTTMITLL
jgi:hypothetical protein